MGEFPLYLKVKSHLRELIEGSVAGDRLPTEAELGQGLRVSRTTVRKALGELEDEGLLIRRAGQGTFVLGRVSPDDQLGLGGLMESAFVAGHRLRSTIEAFGIHPVPDEVARHLQLRPGTETLYYRRIIRRSRRIVTLADVYLVLESPQLVVRADLERMPVFRLLTSLGVRPVHGWRTIRAAVAEPDIGTAMGLEGEQLLLESDVLEMDDQSSPVLFATCRYPADLYRFRLTFTDHGVGSVFLEPTERRP